MGDIAMSLHLRLRMRPIRDDEMKDLLRAAQLTDRGRWSAKRQDPPSSEEPAAEPAEPGATAEDDSPDSES